MRLLTTNAFARNATGLVFGCLALVWSGALPVSALADAPQVPPAPAEHGSARAGVSPLVHLFNFVSRADGERCPMYPTCSHYARQAIAEKGFFKGWVLASDRLLRCGRDEVRLGPPINVHGVRHTYDPLEANVFWWDKR